jgi:hypothetical protein
MARFEREYLETDMEELAISRSSSSSRINNVLGSLGLNIGDRYRCKKSEKLPLKLNANRPALFELFLLLEVFMTVHS